MINIENMTYSELFKLHQETAKKLGFFHMVTVSVADVLENFEQLQEDGEVKETPSEEAIRQALAYVWRQYEGDEWTHAVQWATEVAASNFQGAKNE